MVMGAVCGVAGRRLAATFFGAVCLAKGQLVGRFQRRAAEAADDRGAVAADQRIVYDTRALRAPQIAAGL